MLAEVRRARRLEEYLAVRGQEYLASQGAVPGTSGAPGVRPGITQGEPGLQSEYKPGAGMTNGEVIPMPGQQAPQGQGRGWFGFGGQQQQQAGQAQQPVQAPVGAQQAGNYGAVAGQPRRA